MVWVTVLAYEKTSTLTSYESSASSKDQYNMIMIDYVAEIMKCANIHCNWLSGCAPHVIGM
jgi:hypothetical protein